MDWSSVVIGVGGLLVAALTVYLDYRKRVSPYRELLYAKQVEGYMDVMAALNNWFGRSQSFIALHRCTLDDDSRVGLRKETIEQNVAFHQAYQRWALFLPQEVDERIAAFVRMFNAISSPPRIAKQYPTEVVHSCDPGLLLGSTYSAVFQSMRKAIGTEPLSQDTLRIVGTVDDERCAVES